MRGAVLALLASTALAQPIDLSSGTFRNIKVTGTESANRINATFIDAGTVTVSGTAKVAVLDAGHGLFNGALQVDGTATAAGTGVGFISNAASGTDGFRCATEGCEFQIGPDTKLVENGSTIEVNGGILFKNNAVSLASAVGFSLDSAADIRTDPTVVACSGTAASITVANGTAAVQFDVGTSCAGESTAVLTLPAANSGWFCACSSTTADRIIQQKVMPNASTTTVTLQNIVISTGANGDFTDGADVACMCRGL